MTQEERDLLDNRYELASERIRQMQSETHPAPFGAYIAYFAGWFHLCLDAYDRIAECGLSGMSGEELRRLNRDLYADILPGRYEKSFLHPSYVKNTLGEDFKILSAYGYEFRAVIPCIFEQDREGFLIRLELFLEVASQLADTQEGPRREYLKETLYWYISDYSELAAEKIVRGNVDASCDFASRIVRQAGAGDDDLLYRYGEYVTEDELQCAAHMNGLESERLTLLARTFAEGYRRGFILAGKPLEKKKTVNVRYSLGFERLIGAAIGLFEEMGLQPTICRYNSSLFYKLGSYRSGYTGSVANRQYDYDHREDLSYVLDGRMVTRMLECMEASYQKYAQFAACHGGPAVLETFGEEPFSPKENPDAPSMSREQQSLAARLRGKMAELANTYIRGEERSFTIMALPVPAVGEKYGEIFDETVRINTLDYDLYRRIQQALIDVLDRASSVRILGCKDNHTDLTVRLRDLTDPARETKFENCLADVNIPVGEVFTSPVLKGTSGRLEVGRVFLNDLEYRKLSVTLTDGMVTDYSCGNFEDPEEGRRYFKDNVLNHYDSLPIGEFAIGTNTTAYEIARRYDIAGRMPILIAEKMGPHFALGDTCYSHEEELITRNPDGKVIIAKENEVSALRAKDPDKAYFGCHTDITIPYEELQSITAIHGDGTATDIIRDGRFVLAGTEELNKPLEFMGSMA